MMPAWIPLKLAAPIGLCCDPEGQKAPGDRKRVVTARWKACMPVRHWRGGGLCSPFLLIAMFSTFFGALWPAMGQRGPIK